MLQVQMENIPRYFSDVSVAPVPEHRKTISPALLFSLLSCLPPCDLHHGVHFFAAMGAESIHMDFFPCI